jgi:hypothetical protein
MYPIDYTETVRYWFYDTAEEEEDDDEAEAEAEAEAIMNEQENEEEIEIQIQLDFLHKVKKQEENIKGRNKEK